MSYNMESFMMLKLEYEKVVKRCTDENTIVQQSKQWIVLVSFGSG